MRVSIIHQIKAVSSGVVGVREEEKKESGSWEWAVGSGGKMGFLHAA